MDSSIWVSLVLRDASREVQIMKILAGYDRLATSELSQVEISSGIHAQTGNDVERATLAYQNLNRLMTTIDFFSINSAVIQEAMRLVRDHRVSVGLRSLDAIHVATAIRILNPYVTRGSLEMEYLTADQRQHDAFSREGFIGNCLAH